MDAVMANSDGYTLLLCTHFESINTVLYRNPQYALRDVAPISLIAKYYYGLALSNAIPAATFEQFVAYAKAHPGEVGYISIGIGSAQEILARQLERLTGMSMNRIPYRGGPQVMQDLLSGIVHFYVAPTLQVLPQYESRQLKILAVSSPQRLDVAPEIPTLVEKGIDFVRYGWLGICARAGTPPPTAASQRRRNRGDARISGADHEVGVDTDLVVTRRACQRAHANGGRSSSDHPRIRHAAESVAFCRTIIFSENRYPLFGIML